METVRQDAEIAADLVRRIGEGDATAEAELVERFSPGLAFQLRRLTGDPAEADDLHQETFRVVLLRLRHDGLAEPGKLAGFILGTARHLFANERRKRSRRGEGLGGDDAPEPPDPAPCQLSRVLADEDAARVRRLLAGLGTDRDRELLLRFYLAEEDKERICSDLGLSRLHFNRVLHRARERFKALVAKSAPGWDRGAARDSIQ